MSVLPFDCRSLIGVSFASDMSGISDISFPWGYSFRLMLPNQTLDHCYRYLNASSFLNHVPELCYSTAYIFMILPLFRFWRSRRYRIHELWPSSRFPCQYFQVAAQVSAAAQTAFYLILVHFLNIKSNSHHPLRAHYFLFSITQFFEDGIGSNSMHFGYLNCQHLTVRSISSV